MSRGRDADFAKSWRRTSDLDQDTFRISSSVPLREAEGRWWKCSPPVTLLTRAATATGEWLAVCLLTGPRELDILRCDPGSLRGQMKFHQLKQFAHGERPHTASVQLCPSPLL